ncbi:zinc finger, BED-type [Artemisia annua]|uniref:Zinc finger, BED-type n=1 Tax=Artemisia annua TaxID=35608 RepID=A0A2U1LIZ7_ARTAN|nr:zinc finger, BED-type [Artemisia annua]
MCIWNGLSYQCQMFMYLGRLVPLVPNLYMYLERYLLLVSNTNVSGTVVMNGAKYLYVFGTLSNVDAKDGLEEHITSIDKIRNAVRYLRSSPARLTSFEESAEFEKIDCGRKPCLDVDTRWNSTFLMLETALKFQSAFERVYEDDVI